MSGDEMDYGFEYSDDDDEPEEEDVNIENQYYTAKGTCNERRRGSRSTCVA